METETFFEITQESSPEVVAGALLHIYGYQTSEEQSAGHTIENNNAGFSGCDSDFLSDLAEKVINYKKLTDKQLASVHKAITKYHRQLKSGFRAYQIAVKTTPMIRTWWPLFVKPDPLNTGMIIIQYTNNSTEREWIKSNIDGRQFDWDRKIWIAPAIDENIKKLKDYGFGISENLTNPGKITDLVKITEAGKKLLHVRFPKMNELVQKMRQVPGARWNPDEHCWEVKINEASISAMKRLEFNLPDIDFSGPKYTQGTLPDKLREVMYDYQVEGYDFVESKKGRAIIGDEMGLGKTIQAISYVASNPDKRPVCVVCPASVKGVWKREFKKWAGLDSVILEGQGNKIPEKSEIYIVNYDILSYKVAALREQGIQTLIIDECHYIKNRDTKRTAAVTTLGSEVAKYVIALSGTPITNRPEEYFTTLNLINPDEFDNFVKYGIRYCDGHKGEYGWDFSGKSNEAELYERTTRSLLIRRNKSEVLSQLPAKTRTVVPLQMNKKQQATYDEHIDNMMNEMYDKQLKGGAEALAMIEAAKQAVVKAKIDQAITWIEDYLRVEDKIVVFATHKWTVEKLMTHFGDIAVKIDGSVPTDKRQAVVDQFQTNDKIKVFVGNIKAAGIGITLTAAHATCFLELAWTPGDHDQAEDRVHRIGQTADHVDAYYLLMEGTIEEDIASLLDDKRATLDAVLDNKVTEQHDESLLTTLLKKYGAKDE